MADTVDKVIKVAEAEVGYLEKSKSAYQKEKSIIYEKTKGAGSDNYTKYGKEMHDIYPSVMDFPAYWCDAFVDWCFYKAYGVANAKGLLGGNFDDYTVGSKQLYLNKKAYVKRGEKKPQIGWQIFFTNGTRVCHTGLVYKVDDKYVYTIEGNTSGASDVVANGGGVCKKKYALTNSKIDGYGVPKYYIEGSVTPKVVPQSDKFTYYPKYTGNSVSIVMALSAVGERDTSYAHRLKIATYNGIQSYKGTANQNGTMIQLLKKGILKKI